MGGERSMVDEKMMSIVAAVGGSSGRLCFIDCRPKIAAVANTAGGSGGYENPKHYR